MPTTVLKRTGHKKTVRHYEIDNIFVEPPDEAEKATGKASFFLKRPEEGLTIIFTTEEIARVLTMLRDIQDASAIDTKAAETGARNTPAGLQAYAEHLGYEYNIFRGRMGWRYAILRLGTEELMHREGNLPSHEKALHHIELWLDDKKMGVKKVLP